MNRFEERRDARIARLAARAIAKGVSADALLKRAKTLADVIPFGQPILIGHYSEGRDRRYRGRIESTFRKAFEEHKEAAALADRAVSAANNTAIFTDDPDAPDKLAAKIAKLEKRQAFYKAVNAIVRKKITDDEKIAAIVALDPDVLTPGTAAKVLEKDCFGHIGFPSYALTNNNANIRRLKERLVVLEKREKVKEALAAETGTSTVTTVFGTVRVEEDFDDNRLRIFFPGKPPTAIISELKSCGFRWAPSSGAWQSYLSRAAQYRSEQIVTKFNGTNLVPVLN